MSSEAYLFLDIDGVLNTNAWLQENGTMSLQDTMPEKVSLLCDWLEQHPGIQVVLSSAWRHYWSAEEIQAALQAQDPRFPAFCASTPDLFGLGRDVEILFFLRGRVLENHDVRAVVLDDWPFRNEPLVDSLLVKTDASDGLTEKNLRAASEMLLTPVTARDIDWETFMDRGGKRKVPNNATK